jgi:hypothetical protein
MMAISLDRRSTMLRITRVQMAAVLAAVEEIDPEAAASHHHFWSRFRDWLG